jgi:hypothetical protein
VNTRQTREDPGGIRNVAGEGLAIETELQRALLERIEELQAAVSGGSVSVGKETIRDLEALGYVQ